ncbi:MAG: GSU2204 family CXXCH-containing (seleno)protein [Candidatus Zixiibacteriota bacterium]
MRRKFIVLLIILTGSMAVPALQAANDVSSRDQYSLWLGSHYTDFSDYAKKVGEYNLGNSELLPEFGFSQYSVREGTIFRLDANYFDDQNIFGRLETSTSDRFTGLFQYRSLTKQMGQDNLSNMEVREWLSTRPGGKIVTHEILDPNADYNTNRQELLGRISMLLSRSKNLRLMATHRSILERGTEQSTSSSHCFSCHITSQGVDVDRRTHQFETGVQGDFGKYTIGYQFGYRHFNSRVPNPYASYDPAINPVNGTSGPEFDSRLVFADTVAAYGAAPQTEKLSHKVRVKREIGKGHLAGTAGFTHVTNKRVDLSTDALTGSATYSVPLAAHTRMIARASAVRQRSDDPFIDLPTFRAGRPGPQVSFDYTRWSSLDRSDLKGSLEVIRKLNPRLTMSLLGGYDRRVRSNYPGAGMSYTTGRFTGQTKFRYRSADRVNMALTYRFEKTSDPFANLNGLFEERGRDVLRPLVPGFGFVFYFQREDLKYQNVSTLPTDYHEANLTVSWIPSANSTVALMLKGIYDKNSELDSLDVNHVSFQPNLNVTLSPNSEWAFAGGYNYLYDRAKEPVTVALFDG